MKRELIEVVCDGCGRQEVKPKGEPFSGWLIYLSDKTHFCSNLCHEKWLESNKNP